ncbi:MAG: four helix bundle protein [Vicinamibacterales bacterium]|nr:four helix bundle protein [Vicinamibacterales bacterium]
MKLVIGRQSLVVRGQGSCRALDMIAKTLIDLQVYQKALVGSFAVSALLKHPQLRKDRKLSEQLGAAADSVCSNIAEGFAQQSDRKFTLYLFVARGSANEVRAHLAVARNRDHITAEELSELSRTYDEIGRMLTRFIQYLRRSDRREQAK